MPDEGGTTRGKNRKKWSPRILARYWLFQLPGFVLLVLLLLFIRSWVNLPEWIFWGSLVIWVAKDAALYPFLWKAYEGHQPEGANTLAGERGIAREPLAPRGYIQLRGELWMAELAEGSRPVDEGETVLVREARGLLLIVEPRPEE